MYPRLQGGGYS
ncbi:hypothetical protein ACHAWT_002370 [Skeletonema menzelii]